MFKPFTLLPNLRRPVTTIQSLANRRRSTTLFASGLAAMFAGLLAGGCAITDLYCSVALGDFAVHLDPLDGDAKCLATTALFGLEPLPGKGDGRPDFARSKVALQYGPLALRLEAGRALGSANDPNDDHQPYVLTKFANGHPDAEGRCQTANGSWAEQDLPEVLRVDDPTTPDHDESEDPPLPARHERYRWRNLVIEMTAQVQGTRFWGELEYEDQIRKCKGTYRAVGVWPAIPCVETKDCRQTCTTIKGVPNTKDQTLCDPSSLNPDWFDGDLTCVGGQQASGDSPEVQGWCVLKDFADKK